MTTMIKRALAALVLLAACAETAPVKAQPTRNGASLFAAAPEAQVQLPDQLREISGLAVTSDGRLFGHDDEQAIIHEIDPVRGAIVKSFALGNPVLTGDFEGLAITPDGDFWITTSRGQLLRFREGANGAHVATENFDTGLRDTCEIEGLAYLPSEQSLILACKQHEVRRMRDTVSLYRWNFSGAATPWRELREQDLAAAAGVADFRPSSIEFDAQSGRTILLSANDAALVELSADGVVQAARRLRGHSQPEGAAILPDGSLLISDEGGRGQAALSRYARTP